MTPEQELELLMLTAAASKDEDEKPLTRFQKILEGVATGMGDIVYGGGQFLENTAEELAPGFAEAVQSGDEWLYEKTGGVLGSPKGVTMDDKVKAREHIYREKTGIEEGEFDGARLAGNVATALVGGATRLVPMIAEGAAMGVAMPSTSDDYWGDKVDDATIGALGGAGGKMIMEGGQHIANQYAAPALKAMKERGIQPTVGQAMGGSIGQFEEAAGSIPFAGALFQAPRGRALEEWQASVLNEVLDPIGKSVDEIGVAGMAKAQDLIKQAYKEAEAMMPTMGIGPAFSKGLNEVFGQGIDLGMNEGTEKAFRKIMKDTVWSRIPKVQEFMGPTQARNISEITSANLKKVESELTTKINAKGTDPQLREALVRVRAYIRQEAASQSPEYRAAIQAADKSYAKMKRVVKAENTSAAKEGFQPSQLVRATIQQSGDNTAAAGRGLMQGDAMAAQKILGDTLNDSGTTARAAATALLGTGAGATINPLAMAALPALWMGGTRGGQKLANGLLEYLMAPATKYTPAGMYGMVAKEKLEEER